MRRGIVAVAGMLCLAAVLAVSGTARGWSRFGGVNVVYEGATLAANSTRIDTVVTSSKPTDRSRSRFEQIVWTLGGTSAGTAADSMFAATVKAIVGGVAQHIGSDGGDSLRIAPAPSSGSATGETRLMHCMADSYQVTSRNPMVGASVTGAKLTWYGRSIKDR